MVPEGSGEARVGRSLVFALGIMGDKEAECAFRNREQQSVHSFLEYLLSEGSGHSISLGSGSRSTNKTHGSL